jgi:serine/threonine protein kinase
LERDLAVKILYPHFTDVPGFIERFRREAKAAGALRHPNIIQVFDFDHTEDGLHYMVLEYIDGQTLENFLNAQAPLTLSQTLTLFRQIASATQYAHEHGLIHRDIKPANVLLDKRGQAYLTDFGIAQIVGMSRLTLTDTKAGTPIYMAPEQIEAKPVDVAADVYSLGMLLYKMLTNHLPYEGDNPTLVMVQKLMKPPTSPRRFKPDLPVEVEEVLMTALAHEPENRYPDVVSMTWALEDAYGAVSEMDLADTAVAKIVPAPGDLPLNRLDHYDIREELARSETELSQRYVAYNQMLGGLAILEVLKPLDRDSRELFMKRMTTISQLDNPHIVPINFINQTEDGRSYVSLTYVPAMSLAAKMEAETMTVLLTLHLARQIAYALQTVHSMNLVHGDLRAETIFVGEGERIWLMGLGAVVDTPTIHDNIQAFGRLLQKMLPEESLVKEQPLSSIVINCLTAGALGYDSMTAVRAALDEALANELDREAKPQLVRTAPRRLPVAAGIIIGLALLVGVIVPRLRLPTTADSASATPVLANVVEETAVRLADTPEVLSTPTTAVSPQPVLSGGESEPSSIRLVSIVYNPVGDDVDREYIIIENGGPEAIFLTGWRLEDAAIRTNIFNFPSFRLAAGAQVKIWTRRGVSDGTDIYWGSDTAIWNNDGDTATLFDESGALVDRCNYSGGEDTAVCE